MILVYKITSFFSLVEKSVTAWPDSSYMSVPMLNLGFQNLFPIFSDSMQRTWTTQGLKYPT